MNSYDMLHFLIQIALLLTSALLFGRLAARLKIPRVVGEMLAGIFLGPTFLGIAAPRTQAWLFASHGSVTSLRIIVGNVALLVFLFVAGLETNTPANRTEGKRVLSVSFFGLMVPFLLSWSVAKTVPGLFGIDGFRPWFPLFLGTALSISALPVIARLFMDLHLEHSALASTVLSAAAMDDLAGWALFVMLLGKFRSGDAFSMRAFGAFFVGALCVRWRRTAAARLLRTVSLSFCAPIYFAGIGLQLHLWRDFSPFVAAILFVIACVGKISGAAAGARVSGSSWREALAVGCAMNARGAMEIILATVALDQGIISATLHAGLIFVALATSLIAGPCLNALR